MSRIQGVYSNSYQIKDYNINLKFVNSPSKNIIIITIIFLGLTLWAIILLDGVIGKKKLLDEDEKEDDLMASAIPWNSK